MPPILHQTPFPCTLLEVNTAVNRKRPLLFMIVLPKSFMVTGTLV